MPKQPPNAKIPHPEQATLKQDTANLRSPGWKGWYPKQEHYYRCISREILTPQRNHQMASTILFKLQCKKTEPKEHVRREILDVLDEPTSARPSPPSGGRTLVDPPSTPMLWWNPGTLRTLCSANYTESRPKNCLHQTLQHIVTEALPRRPRGRARMQRGGLGNYLG